MFLIFKNRAFKEGKGFEAENVILIAAESVYSRPDTGLFRVTSSFHHEVVAAGADFWLLERMSNVHAQPVISLVTKSLGALGFDTCVVAT